jgi:hypothetical protein
MRSIRMISAEQLSVSLSSRKKSHHETLPPSLMMRYPLRDVMLKTITFDVKLFLGPYDTKRSRNAMLWLLQGLVGVNRSWLEQYPETPSLYESGIVYQQESPPENWQDIPTLLETGFGDCEDLACYRVAELNTWGIIAGPYIKWRRNPKTGNYTYHALVRRPDGKIEDPSRALGMNGHPIIRKPVFVKG